MDQLTRIETTVARTDERLGSALRLLEAHDKRLRALEDDRTRRIALTGSLGAVAAFLGKYLLPGFVAFYMSQGYLGPDHVKYVVYLTDHVTGDV